MDNKKVYMEKQERLARFAKALGHPARIAILQFCQTGTVLFRRYSRRTTDSQSHCLTASIGIEKRWTDTGYH